MIPALIRKMIDVARARSCSGATARRRASSSTSTTASRGSSLAAERYDGAEPVNLGTGVEISIRELAETIAERDRLRGRDRLGHVDAERPAAPARSTRRRAEELFGFRAGTPLREGLERTVAWYRSTAPAHARVAESRARSAARAARSLSCLAARDRRLASLTVGSSDQGSRAEGARALRRRLEVVIAPVVAGAGRRRRVRPPASALSDRLRRRARAPGAVDSLWVATALARAGLSRLGSATTSRSATASCRSSLGLTADPGYAAGVVLALLGRPADRSCRHSPRGCGRRRRRRRRRAPRALRGALRRPGGARTRRRAPAARGRALLAAAGRAAALPPPCSGAAASPSRGSRSDRLRLQPGRAARVLLEPAAAAVAAARRGDRGRARLRAAARCCSAAGSRVVVARARPWLGDGATRTAISSRGASSSPRCPPRADLAVRRCPLLVRRRSPSRLGALGRRASASHSSGTGRASGA